MENPHYSGSDYAQYKPGPSVTYQPVMQNQPGMSAFNQGPVGFNDENKNCTPNYRTQRRGFFSSIRWWLPEIGASLVSVACFVALVAVVRHFQGVGVQDTGLPSNLTLNGLIALLSTFNRVALMVPIASAMSQEVWVWLSETRKRRKGQLRDLETTDAASRSAFGSFLFLFQYRRSWLAYSCALVTLVSLVFGTFTQQLLALKPFAVSSELLQPGSLPHSEYWQTKTGRPSEGLREYFTTLSNFMTKINHSRSTLKLQSRDLQWRLDQ